MRIRFLTYTDPTRTYYREVYDSYSGYSQQVSAGTEVKHVRGRALSYDERSILLGVISTPKSVVERLKLEARNLDIAFVERSGSLHKALLAVPDGLGDIIVFIHEDNLDYLHVADIEVSDLVEHLKLLIGRVVEDVC